MSTALSSEVQPTPLVALCPTAEDSCCFFFFFLPTLSSFTIRQELSSYVLALEVTEKGEYLHHGIFLNHPK